MWVLTEKAVLQLLLGLELAVTYKSCKTSCDAERKYSKFDSTNFALTGGESSGV